MAELCDPATQDACNTKSEYFRSYGGIDVHTLMLKDKPRTLAYKKFIEENSDEFKDKVVLDVGAGTGILSLFAARAGAKRVFAVEASEMAKTCQEIVKINKLDNTIVVINELVEKVDLPVSKVDVIVSEWMGFYLLHESMLDSVLFARNKWLSEDGLMVPSHAAIYTAPVNMSDYCLEHFEYWNDVYGFDLSPLANLSVQSTLQQPVVRCINPNQVLAEPKVLIKYNLKDVELTDVQELEEKFSFDILSQSVLHGFAFWFDVKFCRQHALPTQISQSLEKSSAALKSPTDNLSNDLETSTAIKTDTNLTLSTSPNAEPTHWKQTTCFLPVTVSVDKGETIYSKITLSQDGENKRFYNITLELLENLESSSEEDSDSDEELEEDVSNHPIPCDCKSGRCKIIRAIMEKYDAEQTELEMEAEFVDVIAEVQAAQTLDKEDFGNDSSFLDANDSEGAVSEEHLMESTRSDEKLPPGNTDT